MNCGGSAGAGSADKIPKEHKGNSDQNKAPATKRSIIKHWQRCKLVKHLDGKFDGGNLKFLKKSIFFDTAISLLGICFQEII